MTPTTAFAEPAGQRATEPIAGAGARVGHAAASLEVLAQVAAESRFLSSEGALDEAEELAAWRPRAEANTRTARPSSYRGGV